MSKRDLELYIEDIQDAISKIEKYVEDLNFDDFIKDTKTMDAVIKNLAVIGEAVRNIPSKIRLKYSEIPWAEIMGMRNKIIHEYFGIDEEILWETIQEDLPKFKEQIKKLQ